MGPVMAELTTETFVASTASAIVGVDYFGPLTAKFGAERKNDDVICSFV